MLLVGCSWLQPIDKKIQQEFNIHLLPQPSEVQENFIATQRVQGSYKGNSYSLQMNLEKNTNKVVLVALGQMGVVLFSVSYDGKTIESATSSLLPKNMNPAYVLRDFLWAYWPLQSLQSAFTDTDFSVQESHGERWIFNKEQPLLLIRYGDDPWDDTVKIDNPLREYALEINTLMREPL